MALYSEVFLKGPIVNVDLAKRDITLQISHSEAPSENVVCHLWTTLADDHGAWRSSDEWRDYVFTGGFARVTGYLGNNGRIVVAPGHLTVLNGSEEPQNTVRGIGKKISDTEMEFRTPSRGKQVIVNIDCPEYSGYQVGDLIAFLGEKTADSLLLINYQKLLSVEELFDVEEGYEYNTTRTDYSDLLQ